MTKKHLAWFHLFLIVVAFGIALSWLDTNREFNAYEQGFLIGGLATLAVLQLHKVHQ